MTSPSILVRRHVRLVVPLMLFALVVGACDSSASQGGAASGSPVASPAGAPPDHVGPSGAASPAPAASPSPPVSPDPPAEGTLPSTAPSAAAPPAASPVGPSGSPAGPRLPFEFAAKGLRGEVMAFVTTSQVDDALARLDFASVSTIAFFSLEAASSGAIRHDGRWRIWTGKLVDRLIARAHESRTKVVISLARFSWSAGQTETSSKLLASSAARSRLAREVADEVVRRGVDGVNVDFEPIPRGQKAGFTDLVRRIRSELDARGPGYQLTFDVVGHFESYDVAGALKPGGAHAVYLMGYHFAGTFSTAAHGTAPLEGPHYAVGDAIRLLRKVARPEQIIVGVPFYGHLWPTKTGALGARTTGRGFDVTYATARTLAAAHTTSYDPAEKVRRAAWQERSCASCAPHWVQLYFDDARSLGEKWAEFRRQELLGTGIWTSAFEGPSGDLTKALRDAWLVGA
ncbi:MAG TPA: glycosyl hydrolase family 18 protein [Candidatus Limnocylindrales bacterium]|jgi:spore germination protein YaaH